MLPFNQLRAILKSRNNSPSLKSAYRHCIPSFSKNYLKNANGLYTTTTRKCVKRNNSSSSSSNSNSNSNSNNSRAVYIHNGIISSNDDKIHTMSYIRGWAWQQIILNQRLAYQRLKKEEVEEEASSSCLLGDNDSLLLLQFDPVYTLGRGAKNDHLTFLKDDDDTTNKNPEREIMKAKLGVKGSAKLNMDQQLFSEVDIDLNTCSKELVAKAMADSVSKVVHKFDPVIAPNGVVTYRVERGGEVTYHGPGQLVAYPLLNLRQQSSNYKQDLHWYLHSLEEVIIKTLSKFDIVGVRDDINTGVWVNRSKIAAIGISSSRWITTHGFAINVNPDLNYFDTSIMIPCGILGRGVTSISNELGGDGKAVPSLEEVSDVTVQCFEDVFGISTVDGVYMC